MLNLIGKRVYLACGSTDMRKQINGLVMIVENSFNLDPFDSALFVFCNRNRDRCKILEWDGDGFWLYLKRLETGHFNWPEANVNETTLSLSSKEFSHLLESPKVVQKLKRKDLKINPPNENLNLQGLDAERLLAVLRSTAAIAPPHLHPQKLLNPGQF